MSQKRNRSHGFATVVALVTLMLVGVTIAGLMTRIAMDARRNAGEAARAQREQIIIAQSMAHDLTLPDELHHK